MDIAIMKPIFALLHISLVISDFTKLSVSILYFTGSTPEFNTVAILFADF